MLTSIFNDTFTDTAGTVLSAHTSDSGGTWTLHPGSTASSEAVITSSNRVREANVSNSNTYYASVTPTSPDYDVHAGFVAVTNVSSDICVAGRIDTTVRDWYYAYAHMTGSVGFYLGKCVGGTFTALGNGLFTLSGSAPIKLIMRGDVIAVAGNGGTRFVTQDTAITAAGRPGIYLNGAVVSDSVGGQFTDLTCYQTDGLLDYRSHSDQADTGGTSTSIDVSRPVHTTDGDLLVVSIATVNTGAMTTVPTGWTSAADTNFSSGGRLRTYYKIASSEPSSWSWIPPAGTAWSAQCTCYTGGGTLDQVATTATAWPTNGSTSAPSVTTTGPNSVVHIAMAAAGAPSTPQQQFTATSLRNMVRGNAIGQSPPALYSGSLPMPTAGATGTMSWTRPGISQGGAQQTVSFLAPAATAAALAGAIDGTSTADAAALTEPQDLAGSAAGASTVAATRIAEDQPLAGTVAGTGTADAGAIAEDQPLAGQIDGASTVDAPRLPEQQPLAGSATGAGTADATRLTEPHALAGSITGTSTVDGDLTPGGAAGSLSGTVAGAGTAAATRLTEPQPMAGTVTGAGTAAGSGISEQQPLAGPIAGTSTTAGAGITEAQPLSGPVAGSGAADAARIAEAQPLAGTAAGSSTADAAGMVAQQPLAGSIDGAGTADAILTGGQLVYIFTAGRGTAEADIDADPATATASIRSEPPRAVATFGSDPMPPILGPFYAGATFTYTRPHITGNGDPLTSGDPPDEITAQLSHRGTLIGSPVPMSESPTDPGTWSADLTAPNPAGDDILDIVVSITKDAGEGRLKDRVEIRPWP